MASVTLLHRGHLRGATHTLIPNNWIEDERLSWTAAGVLVYLATRVRVNGPVQPFDLADLPDGDRPGFQHVAHAALDELAAAGYVRIEGRNWE